MKRLDFHAMGSRMLAVIDSDVPSAIFAVESVPAWFEEWEQVLSRFRFDSELSLLNRSHGRPMPVSETLWDVFQVALGMENETAGVVTPVILDALVQAGYDRSFDMLPVDTVSAATRVLEPPLLAMAGQDPTTRTLWFPDDLHLDFGGFSKGWAAQQAVYRLMPHGPALVDAGGDIAISGPPCASTAWSIGVLDPFHPESNLETLRVERGGIATSGVDYHRWKQDGHWNHHIIDPRIGLPASSDILTATIIAPDAVRAEVAAKYVLISGSKTGLDWLEADSLLAGIMVLQTGESIYSRRMPEYLWSE
jgi:thiamine biosynthesis lipoprotein